MNEDKIPTITRGYDDVQMIQENSVNEDKIPTITCGYDDVQMIQENSVNEDKILCYYSWV